MIFKSDLRGHRTECPEIKPHFYGQLTFDKDAKTM